MSGFAHHAFFYRDERQWLGELLPYARAAVAAGVPVLVAVSAPRIELMRSALGSDASAVDFVTMESVGKNPGRMLSAWHDYIDRHALAPRICGIGEPVWPGRRPDEVVECLHNEHLVNVALEGCAIDLVCPYDIAALPADVIDAAVRAHPSAGERVSPRVNPAFAPSVELRDPLTPPPAAARTMAFDVNSLRALRQMVEAEAAQLRLEQRRADDLVLAVSEAATNSVQYGGSGVMTVWADAGRLVCQIADAGRLSDPLVGRRRPAPDAPRGRGVWLLHQVCDLVQIRCGATGTTVRLSIDLKTG